MKTWTRSFFKFAAGFVVAVLLMIIVPLLVLATGLVDFSARPGPSKIESILAPWALDRSMDRHAPTTKNPFAEDKTAVAAALPDYRGHCLLCHGVPEVPPRDFAQGLNPPPPPLLGDDAQNLPDGQMFWIIRNGIRMTGMPAFGDTCTDEEIWKLVVFVKHLPNLTDAETSALKSATTGEAHSRQE